MFLIVRFQFHKGSIKTFPDSVKDSQFLPNFNSIKVRLRPNENEVSFCLCKFQFHKGSIKTLSSNWQSCKASVFQFHKGSIKTASAGDLLPAYNNFNSIKVRLRLFRVWQQWAWNHQFQFHKGSIKTPNTYRPHYHGIIISIP